jgi:hypothetical protein
MYRALWSTIPSSSSLFEDSYQTVVVDMIWLTGLCQLVNWSLDMQSSIS